jgi:hypothetical protein
MNAKLNIKLAAKAAKIKVLITKPFFSSIEIGKAAFEAVGGSYGVTINPFSKKTEAFEHAQFRKGFVGARDAKKNIVRGKNNITHRTRGAFGKTKELNDQTRVALPQVQQLVAA